jgi:hypothetical protein
MFGRVGALLALDQLVGWHFPRWSTGYATRYFDLGIKAERDPAVPGLPELSGRSYGVPAGELHAALHCRALN